MDIKSVVIRSPTPTTRALLRQAAGIAEQRAGGQSKAGILSVRKEQRIGQPRYWDEMLLNNPIQPVVGVSWHEAASHDDRLIAQGY